MEPVLLSRVAQWVGGATDTEVMVGPDVVIDSRAATPGSLFVAFPGERVDGHDYVGSAADAGAAAALVEHPVDHPLPQIVVPDAVTGLTEVARGVVADALQHGLITVGVTGSSGKTSTKDLIASVLETGGPTVAPPGSFNNEIGHPLTACRVTHDTRFLVSEMGARGIGHVAWLCSVTPPVIGAVLNVGHAHLGEFGSQDVIAQAKGELVEALPAHGWAVLNADDERVAAMASRTPARLAFWSTVGEPTRGELRVWASEVTPDELQRYGFTLHAAGACEGAASVQLKVTGEHQVANALAAATVGLAAGLEPDAVAAALTAATARSPMRMDLQQRADGAAVLNDCYNANPDSMAAGLRAVARLRRPGGRVIAVVGDMLELGEGAEDAHRAVGVLAAELGVDEVLAIGDFAETIVAGYGRTGSGRAYHDSDALAADALAALGPADVVLVKASRGLALETIAARLLAAQGEQQ